MRYGERYTFYDKKSDFKYDVKKGPQNVIDEYAEYQKISNIDSKFVKNCLLKIYKFTANKDGESIIVQEYIDGYHGYAFDLINSIDWPYILLQIAYFIDKLDLNKINHGDFSLDTIKITKDNKQYHVKIISFGNNDLYDNKLDEDESYDDKFYLGRDLNQLFNNMLENCDKIPKDIYTMIKNNRLLM